MNNISSNRAPRPLRPAPRPVMRTAAPTGYRVAVDTPKHENVLLRREIGEVLRAARQQQGRTLREVSSQARVSLGYLSEVERGQKEASSELLASICQALDVPLSVVLRQVSDRIAMTESVIPDTVPDELLRQQGVTLG
ncbi:helix-turn-helix domain-containing protein [Actinomyces weissii]|uniref:Helix-turn-helix domain-containing protein n=1 Tax=Actinomyces weissii TaxID=675090 RepID=A0A7T7MB00_9ACTO|nr:helix-turn-helix domain-containing protein [Actinomyces weissii]